MTVKYALAQSDLVQQMYRIYLNICDVRHMFDRGAIECRERDARLSDLKSQLGQKFEEYHAEICAEVMET